MSLQNHCLGKPSLCQHVSETPAEKEACLERETRLGRMSLRRQERPVFETLEMRVVHLERMSHHQETCVRDSGRERNPPRKNKPQPAREIGFLSIFGRHRSMASVHFLNSLSKMRNFHSRIAAQQASQCNRVCMSERYFPTLQTMSVYAAERTGSSQSFTLLPTHKHIPYVILKL